MPKHSARQFTTARLILSFAAALLVALVGWVAIRAGGPAAADDEPVIVEPSAPVSPVPSEPGVPPSPSAEAAAASPSPSASASPSRPSPSRPSPSPSRKPKKSPSPSASPSPSKTSSSPAGSLQVTYGTVSTWRDGFTAGVRVVNNGSAARDFVVTVTFASGTDLRIRADWNASVSAEGNRVTLRGGPVAPGASVTAGFQAAKDDDDSSRASGCAVVGGTCAVS